MHGNPSPLDRVVDELGAELQLRLRALPVLTPIERSKERRDVLLKSAMLTDDMGRWTPYEFPHEVARVCVVWDRPTPHGFKARTIVRAGMGQGGIDDEDVAHVWAYPMTKNTPPTAAEVETWREVTLNAISASGAKYLLLVGAVAVGIWRPELPFKQVEGKTGVLDGRWYVYPMYNPIAVLQDAAMIQEWREGMREFCDVVNADQGTAALANYCNTWECSEPTYMYDPDGVAWCKRHVEDGMRKRKNMMVGRAKRVNQRNQEGML